MKQVTVTVPATTANLGPGFDCLGMALSLHNKFTFTEADTPLTIVATGEDAHKIPLDTRNQIYWAADFTFKRLGKRPSGLHISQHNCIPVGSGLGSSSTAVVSGIMGANAIVNGGLSKAEILSLATELEGHPDNVSPAIYGGLTLTLMDGHHLHAEQINTPPFQVAIVLPTFDLLTAEARAALPKQIPMSDAIFNIGRLGLLIRALETGDHNKLRLAMQDKLHQPYRLPLIPGSERAMQAAYNAGATAVALSGAGPSLIAFAPANQQAIVYAITHAFERAGLSSRHWLLTTEPNGASVHIA
jgi:homoserine kinase